MYIHIFLYSLIHFQFRVPVSEMEKLQQAQSEEQHIAILETLAQDLPVNNRTIRGGKNNIFL